MADLTTVDKVRAYLGLESVEANDILAQLVASSSAWVNAQIGRQYGTSTVTETLNGDGTTRMQLGTVPVTAVTSVTVDGDAVPARATVDGTGWVLSADGIDLVGYGFTKGIQNVVVVYTAGETVPADLEQAVIEHVALKYRRRGNLGLGSSSGGGESVSYADAGVIAGINDVLDHYRELVVL